MFSMSMMSSFFLVLVLLFNVNNVNGTLFFKQNYQHKQFHSVHDKNDGIETVADAKDSVFMTMPHRPPKLNEDIIFEKLTMSSKVSLDCENNQITILENKIIDDYIEERKVLKSLGYIK